jgi:hypothetical protein
MPRLSCAVRTKQPLPPREDGIACMEFGFNFAVSYMIGLGALPPDYVRDRKINIMSRHLGNIAAIVNETVVDDEKAGLLMRTVGYALDYMANLGRIDGEHGPSCELRYDAALRKKGGNERATRNKAEALAKWDYEPMRLWAINQRDLPLDDPRRMTNDQVRDLILDEAADFIRDKKGKVASSGTVEGHIRRWRKAAGMSDTKQRRT